VHACRQCAVPQTICCDRLAALWQTCVTHTAPKISNGRQLCT
jgi:hypothetical protein